MVARKNAAATPADEPKEIVTYARPDDRQLRAIKEASDALELAVQMYGAVDDITDFEIGNGFTILADKKRLVNTPFVILHTAFNMGTWGEFVSFAAVTLDANAFKFIVNDGSTGLYEQMKDVVASAGRPGGFAVKYGLRESTYATCPGTKERSCGKPLPKGIADCPRCEQTVGDERAEGQTFYLNLSGE